MVALLHLPDWRSRPTFAPSVAPPGSALTDDPIPSPFRALPPSGFAPTGYPITSPFCALPPSGFAPTGDPIPSPTPVLLPVAMPARVPAPCPILGVNSQGTYILVLWLTGPMTGTNKDKDVVNGANMVNRANVFPLMVLNSFAAAT
eukprot:11649686-Ditylum_brightwellii.AAC.1